MFPAAVRTVTCQWLDLTYHGITWVTQSQPTSAMFMKTCKRFMAINQKVLHLLGWPTNRRWPRIPGATAPSRLKIPSIGLPIKSLTLCGSNCLVIGVWLRSSKVSRKRGVNCCRLTLTLSAGTHTCYARVPNLARGPIASPIYSDSRRNPWDPPPPFFHLYSHKMDVDIIACKRKENTNKWNPISAKTSSHFAVQPWESITDFHPFP